MAAIEEFESKLKEVVTAKRLSASKMEKLTEVTMKLMENDTQLVSILYRTHKSLRASSKISSLYVFDALCRAARNQVVKHNLSGDINAEEGNCATFLLKIDTVLDGLFQDILSSGVPEAKEKTKKILDIWTKSNTFPSDVLARLGALSNGAESSESNPKETKSATFDTSTSTSDPRKQPTPSNVITPPPAASVTPPTAEAAQAALLALLTTAANTNNPSNVNQIPASIHGAVPPQAHSQEQLGQLQFALLQQLSKNNTATPTSSMPSVPTQHQTALNLPGFTAGASPFPTHLNIPARNPNLPGPSSASPINAGSGTNQGQGTRDPRFNKFDATRDGNARNANHFDNRYRDGNTREYLGGFRGRGRGNFRGLGEGRREPPTQDRGNSPHYEGGPPPHRRRFDSRSQSPSGRRDQRPRYSRNREDSLESPVERSRAPIPGALEPGKDEFGRDIRASSDDSGSKHGAMEDKAAHEPDGIENPRSWNGASTDGGRQVDKPKDNFDPTRDCNSNTTGLESFDLSTFDPTSVESWQALGEAFQVTHGYVPSQEELIHLVMTTMGMMMGMGMGMNANFGAYDADSTTGVAGPDAASGNAGSDTGCPGWSADPRSKASYKEASGACVLGQNTEDASSESEMTSVHDADTPPTSAIAGDVTGASGGRMQKVGNSWKFVREGL